MYKLKILTINQNADSKFFSAWLRENYRPNYIGGAVGHKVILSFHNESSEETRLNIQSFYEGLTSEDILPDYDIIKEFEQMQIDGKVYFFEAKAKYFGLRYKDGTLTDSNINYCYSRLEKVENRLNNGDWKPALYYLENEIGDVTQVDIDNGYTQEIHDSIVQDMNDYINN
jgi:hypothetical protein